MHAVNLIPADARIGGGQAAGRSGGAVYVVLGGLAVLVALMGLYFLASTHASDKQAELAALQTQVQQAQAGASGDTTPGLVHQQRAQVTATVRQLAEQRMNWGALLNVLGRTLPANTTLTGLDASTDGSSNTGAAGSAPAAAAADGTVGPTIDLKGCAPSQSAVARLMPRLRAIPDAAGVQLVSSAIADPGGTGAATTGAADCSGAAFEIVLTLTAKTPPAVAGATAPGTTTTPGAATTTPATTAPAATATPAAGTTAPATPATAAPVTPATATPPSTGAGG